MTNQQENNQIMESFINRMFFKKSDEDISFNEAPCVEMYVNTTCDLKCSYCYIHKFRKELFPQHLNKKEIILKNAQALLDHIFENEYQCRLELFSGELFSQELGFELLELIYTYVKEKPHVVKGVMVPSNMNFLTDIEKIKRVEDLMYRFAKVGPRICISCSVDGPYLTENRAFVSDNELRDNMFYNYLFKFAKAHGCGFHPMVSAVGIEKWIDNYNWFIENIKKFELKDMDGNYIEPMMLEVRNNDWTDESITELLKFYDHLFDSLIKKYGSKEEFVKTLYQHEGHRKIQYCNVEFMYETSNNKRISCAIQNTLHVRMGDLAIVNCHRLAYDELLLGYLKVDDNNKITGVEAINPSLLAVKNTVQSTALPKCVSCKYKQVCMKGCLGAQYEESSDMFYPIDSVCKMLTAKYDHLVKRYHELGLFEIMFQYLEPFQIEYYKNLIKEAGLE